MKPRLQWLYALLVPAFAILSFSGKEVLLPIGSKLPKGDVRVQDVSGKLVTMNACMQANGLLVMFSCNTCPYVIRNQSRTRAICRYALDQKIGVILLNANEANRDGSESLAAMKSYADRQGYQWYYAVDKNNEIADAFGANRTPECFLFDRNGTLVYHGAIDNNPGDASGVTRQHLKEAMSEMLEGKEVSIKETRSVGCNIKRVR